MADRIIANGAIRAPAVCLIDENGNNLGEMETRVALRKAQDINLDLVQVGLNSEKKMPVCKIMDYNRMKYEKSKRKTAKTKSNHVKNIKFRPRIGDNDLEIKKKKIRDFIKKSNKVKFEIILRGREKSFRSDAREMFVKQVDDLADVAKHDDIKSTNEGFFVTLSPL